MGNAVNRQVTTAQTLIIWQGFDYTCTYELNQLLADDFIQAALRNQGPMQVEDVVDWKVVAERYLKLQGLADGVADSDKDEDDDDHPKPQEDAAEQH